MTQVAPNESKTIKMVPVRLSRNYRPMSEKYEVLGYHKEPVLRKRPDGKIVEIEPGGFITETDPETGKVMSAPPAMPGTGFGNRLNANTVVKLPSDEAKRAQSLKIGEVQVEDD